MWNRLTRSFIELASRYEKASILAVRRTNLDESGHNPSGMLSEPWIPKEVAEGKVSRPGGMPFNRFAVHLPTSLTPIRALDSSDAGIRAVRTCHRSSTVFLTVDRRRQNFSAENRRLESVKIELRYVRIRWDINLEIFLIELHWTEARSIYFKIQIQRLTVFDNSWIGVGKKETYLAFPLPSFPTLDFLPSSSAYRCPSVYHSKLSMKSASSVRPACYSLPSTASRKNASSSLNRKREFNRAPGSPAQ